MSRYLISGHISTSTDQLLIHHMGYFCWLYSFLLPVKKWHEHKTQCIAFCSLTPDSAFGKTVCLSLSLCLGWKKRKEKKTYQT